MAEKRAVTAQGNEYGCQTCGTKDPGTKSGFFVNDHHPANLLTLPGEQQTLYPQCMSCSNKQGGYLSVFKSTLGK
jgi:hypothetical protein